MKLTQITATKNFKVGLPNFSNITVGLSLQFEIEEGEQPDFDGVWDTINHQLANQTDIDPAWMKSTELKDSYKLILKVKKNGK